MTETITDKCGTYAGYQQHIRLKDKPCTPCRIANREYARKYRAENEAVRRRELEYTTARTRAIARLIALHPAQWDALLTQERSR